MEIRHVDKTLASEKGPNTVRPGTKREGACGSSDCVELSGEARALLGSEGAPSAAQTEEAAAVRVERVAEVRDRMALGFYDRPDVRQSVLANLVESILGSQSDAK